MVSTGTRNLKDITDAELDKLVEISGCYGVKEYWTPPKITRIDRDMFEGEIVIYFEQTRISDGDKSNTILYFNYEKLSYFVSMDYPYKRQLPSDSVCEHTQMFLWLMAQDFDVLERLTYDRIEPRNNGQTYKTSGWIASRGHIGHFNLDESEYFSPEERDEALCFITEQKKNNKYFRLFRLTREEIDEEQETESE